MVGAREKTVFRFILELELIFSELVVLMSTAFLKSFKLQVCEFVHNFFQEQSQKVQ